MSTPPPPSQPACIKTSRVAGFCALCGKCPDTAHIVVSRWYCAKCCPACAAAPARAAAAKAA